MSKFEWRKHLKELYLPGTEPTTIHVPPMKFFTIDGKGNPTETISRTYRNSLCFILCDSNDAEKVDYAGRVL